MKKYLFNLSGQEKIGFIYNMATMLSSGIPILEVVESLLEDAKGNTKKLLSILRADLQEGAQVHSSFAKFPLVFDTITISIIKASEQAGTLDVALNDIRTNLQKDIEFQDKIRAALIYPALIAVVFSGVMAVILFFVIPKLADVFNKTNIALPVTTKFLFSLSTFLNNNALVVGVCAVILIFLIILVFKFKKRDMLNLLTGLPGIKGLTRQIDLTRFSRSLYLLLSSGITITQALELTQKVVLRREVANVIKKCLEMVLAGKYVSEGFKKHRSVVPGIVIKITEAGERSGTLDKSMKDISEYLEFQTSSTLRTLTASIEPIMLIIVGVLIGGMMVSIIAPMYSIISQVGSSR